VDVLGKFEILGMGGKLATGRRTLIIGPPNSLKTTSLLTWPGLKAIMSYPGEKGYDTLPLDRDDILPFVWKIGPEEDITKLNPHEIVKEVEQTTAKIIGGKYGDTPVQTFAGDGLHKLYEWYYARARRDLDSLNVEDNIKDARAYGYAHKDFIKYLTMVTHSSIQYAVFTCWSARERDDPDNTSTKAPTHIWPALPGQMANLILGEFSVVMFADSMPVQPGSKLLKARWQLKPEGKVWGVGVKAPKVVVEKLPVFVEADWSKLEPMLLSKEGSNGG
jgi:hypothetical protein